MSAGDEEFGDPSTYPYLVVASPSCHDTSTSRAWFQEDEGRRERFVQKVVFRKLCDSYLFVTLN